MFSITLTGLSIDTYTQFTITNGNACITLPVPDGTDPDSLNCQVGLCNLADSGTTFEVGELNVDYSTLHAQCPGQSAGGEVTDNTYSDSVSAYANPNYNPSKKRGLKPAPAFNSRILKKRQTTPVRV